MNSLILGLVYDASSTMQVLQHQMIQFVNYGFERLGGGGSSCSQLKVNIPAFACGDCRKPGNTSVRIAGVWLRFETRIS
jgi:hypothetical protein